MSQGEKFFLKKSRGGRRSVKYILKNERDFGPLNILMHYIHFFHPLPGPSKYIYTLRSNKTPIYILSGATFSYFRTLHS